MIANKYKIEKKLGNGSFGSIYQGFNLRTREKVAIKMESNDNDTKSLKNETRVYQYLNGCQGIPKIRWFGTDSKSTYMVIDLLGCSLTDVIQQQGKLSLPSILKIGIQMLDILEGIHEKGMIHRDIKPDNFLIDPNRGIEKIYLIDFGVSKTYLQPIESQKTSAMIGTPNFASINAHHFMELSRRDDLESLLYTLLFLSLGYLPWTLQKDISREKMLKMKMEWLVDNKNIDPIPKVFIETLKYIRKLGFKERPFYQEFKKMFSVS